MKDISKTHNLTGLKFGKLTVIGIEQTLTRKTYWKCMCECGNYKIVRSDSLICGTVKSCGCLKKQQDRINLTANHSHKMSRTRLYHTWINMKSRCYNKNNKCYDIYGERGITVCDEWINSFESFKNWAAENGYSESLTLDRIDTNGNYEPDNCRWATPKEQANNRRTNHLITIDGTTKNLTQWCEYLGVKVTAVKDRARRHPNEKVEEIISKLIPR